MEIEPVFDGVAACRAALARYPNAPELIIAHYNASEALFWVAFGRKFPDSDEEAFALALQLANADKRPLMTRIMAFYLGSAYEYGVGTKVDRAAAMKWYAVAVGEGDAISKRELARLQAATP
jgi:TPR repeat protein